MSLFVPTSLGNSIIGIAFLILAAGLTLLMFYIWKFPFDHDRYQSAAPPSAILAHRILGYLFVLIYVYIMWQMVPRLWSYQIELPARTVLHLALGTAIGALLILKILIVRFFRHLEARLAPALGIGLFLCSFLLVTLVLPFSLREAYLESVALGDDEMLQSRIRRISALLPAAGLDDEAMLARLASREGLTAGRRILADKCVQCHDLRTVLARPRTPQSWRQTVSRMASRSTIVNPITDADQWFVTAYLVAVSPTLQQTLKQRRQMESRAVDARSSLRSALDTARDPGDGYDHAAAREIFLRTCSQCHDHRQVELAPPGSRAESIALVERMVGNGLVASATELRTIIHYLTNTYAEPGAPRSGARAESADTVSPPGRGETLYGERGCGSCHGAGGENPISDEFPVLAGQNRDYLIRQFMDIQSGARDSGLAPRMRALVQDISEEEIAAIAGYLSNRR